jgi:hypothetical protein
LTLEEFQAQKKANLSGVLKKAETRKVEEHKGKNLEKATNEKEKTETISSKLHSGE